MSPTDISRIQGVAGVRQDNAAQIRFDVPAAATPAPATSDAAASTAAPEVKVDAAPSTDLRTAPVDTDRVREIRAAIESGNYPLMPAQIADAMIAAPLLLSAEA